MRSAKKLEDRRKRGLWFEIQGLEPGVIGTKDRVRRLAKRVRRARLQSRKGPPGRRG